MLGRSKPATISPSCGNAELDEDVLAGALVGGRGQRQPRHVGKRVEQRPEQPVIGPEIVAPFADAMRLVDRDQRQRSRARASWRKRLAGRPLRRDVEQVELAALAAARSSRSRLASAEVSEAARMPNASAARIWSCISAISGEITSAVPSRRQRRHLVAERLARAGRHHRQRVLPGHDAADHLLLDAAEIDRSRRSGGGCRGRYASPTRHSGPAERLSTDYSAASAASSATRSRCLARPHLGVEAALAQQLVVGAALGDAALVEHDDLVGVDHGRQAVGDDDRGAAARRRRSSVSWIAASVRLSSALVASSRIRIGGFLSRVRAIATRCFSPPDSLRPRSPTIAS